MFSEETQVNNYNNRYNDTEKRNLKKYLKKAEREYEALFENTGAATCLLGNDTSIILVNKEMEKLTGYRKDEIEGKMSWTSFISNNEDLQKMIKYHNDRRRKNIAVPNKYEFELIDKYKNKKNILATIDLITNTSKSVASFVDITKLKRTERELKDKISSLNSIFEKVIEALGSTVKVRDSYTYMHQKNVAKLALAIAQKMGINKEDCRGLYFAAMIHDIGKINVPVEILTKNSKLTKLEYEIIKTHSTAGFDILKNIEFPWPIAQIVRQHHEKLDGSGYPDGITGDNILLEARIISVSDVVEAISSHCPYRPALGIGIALEEIEKNKDILYDPDVVDACFVVVKEDKENLFI